MSTNADLAAVALERWRNSLIDLTRRNPLLSLKSNRTTYLEIVQPDLMKVYEHLLGQGKDWLFFLPTPNEKDKKNADKQEAPRVNELVTSESNRQELLTILTNLYRRSWTDYRERGLHILYLALGFLHWRDEQEETFQSPVLLLPVQLERHSLKDPFVLRAAEEEPIVNPALVARLKQDFDFRLPLVPEDWEEKKPGQYLAELKSSISGLPGWELQPSIVLTLFSFFKGVIFQDLLENAERVQTHPIVQTVAGAHGLLPRGVTVEEKDLDEKQDPRQVCHILDADGSQRLCLEAAAQGESFVLIGPPGTGKSQTIANLIADRLAQGKKVLFVSEKMAALEVVYKRLCQAGVGDFCLELHSHKANKREVIKELARCYQEKISPQAQPSAEDFAKCSQRRDHLQAHVHALHQRREPMKKSVWEALAELPRWQELPLIPLGLPAVRQANDTATKLTLAEFEPAHLDELTQLLQRLQHHWHIRTEKNYPWRGFKVDRYTLQLRDEVVSLIDRIRSRDEKLRTSAEHYAQQLGLRGSIADLLKLGDLLEKRPLAPNTNWLTIPDLSALSASFEKCADEYQRLGQTRQPLTERYGPGLWMLANGATAKITEAWKNALPLLAPGDERGADFLKFQQKLRAWAAETQKRIPGWITDLRTLEKWFPLPLPTGAGSNAGSGQDMKFDPGTDSLKAFLRLASLCVTDHPADKSWLTDRNLVTEAQALIASSKQAFLGYKKNRQELLKVYDEKLFDLDLIRIAEAYRGWYRNWLCSFSWQYRKDRRAISKCRPSEVIPRTVAADMQLGAQVLTDRARLNAEEPRRRQLLGRYEKGLDTDIENAERAARLASEALDLTAQLECESLPSKCVEALTSGAPQEKIRAAIKRANESYVAWAHLTQELQTILPMTRLPGVGEPLEDCSLSALTTFAKDLQTALNQFASLADPLLGSGHPADMQTFVDDLKQAEELLAWESSQATEAERWAKLLGPGFQGVSTDWEGLRKAMSWTRRVRECLATMKADNAQNGCSPQLLEAVTGTPPAVREIRQALEPYEHALHSLEIRFDAPGPQLDGKPLREHTPEAVLDLLTRWRERVGELADWVDWLYLPERFQHLGLKAFWDHLQQHDVPHEQVVHLFLKSFWSGWLDAMFQNDPILSQYRRNEHEKILQEFIDLDRRIVQQGGARITALLGSPQTKLDESAEGTLLLREAHKKARHLPLRQFFDSISSLLLKLKPCMLMSPLSVSQFLPADPSKLQFDLIVFDEASQILPEDAIGAIYRGNQLVVTGDNQQLPPTTFFQQNTESVENNDDEVPLFESVLDACLGAGMPQQMLRWHYRSQHEHLIAFSNESFYEGRLVTFPSAYFQHSDLGVQLHYVPDGVYDRGGKRDNLREAQVVAQLVLEHVRQSPDKTLGVIAFSYAQMNAIEDEIERQLRERPDLETFFKSDRLEGFFVKNLETVQGDERDVILLSVGYGRDEHGKIELNFGPLNREGGERRLNVAVTRARKQLIVVSSIRGNDLQLSDTPSKGLAHLKRYLDFAEHGVNTLLPDENSRLPLTGLHEEVMQALKKMGLESVPYVGCGTFRIDIGVRDPQQNGHFLLGIAFDGPMYAQAETVRDRDRLRPEVLARLGWKLHRISAADWVYRREEEMTRLQQALSEHGQGKK